MWRLLLVLLLVGCTESSYTTRDFENWQHRKFIEVTRQGDDFTCGAASLSTILRFYYDKAVTERQILDLIKAGYDDKQWQAKQRDGLSLLDLKNAAIQLGFSAEGMKMTVADLDQVSGPIIVHLLKNPIQHFSVFRGVRDDRVMLSDPVFGNSRMAIFDFAAQWTGYALAVWIEGADQPTGRMTIKPWETPTEVDSLHETIHLQPLPPVPYPQS